MFKLTGFERFKDLDIIYGIGEGEEVIAASRTDVLAKVAYGGFIGRGYSVTHPSPQQAALIAHPYDSELRAIECLDARIEPLVRELRDQEVSDWKTLMGAMQARTALANDEMVKRQWLEARAAGTPVWVML